MKSHVSEHPENENDVVRYDRRFDEYSIAVPGHASGLQSIYFCPWCGHKLPPSLRDRWFDELEAIGIDPLKDEIPLKYQTEAWREGRQAPPGD